jgi:hypothetical protein
MVVYVVKRIKIGALLFVNYDTQWVRDKEE